MRLVILSPMGATGGDAMAQPWTILSRALRRADALSRWNGAALDYARSSAFDISGTEYVWRSSAPGIPVRTLGSSDHANPLIVLDEIDKAGATVGGNSVEALLPLLQSDMARDFVCPFLQGSIDLSWISWIATANDLSRVPDPIKDRMKIFRVEAPRGAGLRQVVAARLGRVGHSRWAILMLLACITSVAILFGSDCVADRIAMIPGMAGASIRDLNRDPRLTAVQGRIVRYRPVETGHLDSARD
ncbi:hypothetical protein M2324_001955 [Rhodovulum sulfidophilum]|nr:hypothetical protein [Rhodovulum sulfidophilum]